jgi:hypothetical protein
VRTALLLAGLLLAVVGCTTSRPADTTLAAKFAHSASTGAFR